MATGAKVKLGFKATLNVFVSAAWHAMTGVSDLTVSPTFKEAAASMRQYGVDLTEPTLLGFEINGKVRSDDGDTYGYDQLEAAFLARAALNIMVLDGAIATDGSRGFRMDMKVFKWEEEQGLDGVLYRAFTLKPCVPINDVPQSVICTSSTPAFTAV